MERNGRLVDTLPLDLHHVSTDLLREMGASGQFETGTESRETQIVRSDSNRIYAKSIKPILNVNGSPSKRVHVPGRGLRGTTGRK